MKKILLILTLILLMGAVNATDCTCTNCTDCTAQLNNVSCDRVNLTADITDHSGTCINNPTNFNNKTFDCAGNTIDGDDDETDYGININSKENNTIKNCIVTDFYRGIYLYASLNNNLTNNTANSNPYEGILLSSSSNNNTLTNNTANDNSAYGIRLYASLNNNLTNNTANNNSEYGLSVTTSSMYNIITNNTCNNNTKYGIVLYSSSNNTLTNNTVYNNTLRGISISFSNNSIINNNTVCSSETDFYVASSLGNSGDNNTCDTTYNWNDEGTARCSYACPPQNIIQNMTIISNVYGIALTDKTNILINSSTVENNTLYGVYGGNSNFIVSNSRSCYNAGFDIFTDINNIGSNNTLGRVYRFRDSNYYAGTYMCEYKRMSYWWFKNMPRYWQHYYRRNTS